MSLLSLPFARHRTAAASASSLAQLAATSQSHQYFKNGSVIGLYVRRFHIRLLMKFALAVPKYRKFYPSSSITTMSNQNGSAVRRVCVCTPQALHQGRGKGDAQLGCAPSEYRKVETF